MTVSSVSNNAAYTSLLNKLSTEANNSSANSKTASSKLSQDQLASLAKTLAAGGASTDSSSTQDLVSLGKAVSSSSNDSEALYNAKGLLLTVRSSMQLFTPDDQSSSGGTDSGSNMFSQLASAGGQSNALNNTMFTALNAAAAKAESAAQAYKQNSGTASSISVKS